MQSTVTPHKCHLKYHAYSYFSRDPARRVTGTVTDESGTPKLSIVGTWDEQLEVSKITKVLDGNKFETEDTKPLWQKVSIS